MMQPTLETNEQAGQYPSTATGFTQKKKNVPAGMIMCHHLCPPPKKKGCVLCMTGRVLPEEADKTEAESSAGRDGASKAEELVNITDMFVQLPRLGGRSTELAASERGAKGNKVTTQKL